MQMPGVLVIWQLLHTYNLLKAEVPLQRKAAKCKVAAVDDINMHRLQRAHKR